MSEQKIELGDCAKDTISGIDGIVVAKTEWLNGCVRVTLQRTTTDKDGKFLDNETFDEQQVQVTESGFVHRGKEYKSLSAAARAIAGNSPHWRYFRGNISSLHST